jgi:threonine synthase
MRRYSIRCTECGAEMESDHREPLCTRCNGLLEIRMSLGGLGGNWRAESKGVWRYRPLLPIPLGLDPVTLGEGDTPLLRTPRLGRELGLERLYVKFEGSNPTGSFKDRGMTVGITHALELKERKVACASTGNTSASLAAYAARAGLRALILIPSRGVALGKLSQAAAMGAEVVEVDGNFDEALGMLLASSQKAGAYILNSINPFRIEGQKTVAFEICDQLGAVPDNVVLPVGNAGNISAAWKGFCELKEVGAIGRTPRLIGVQAVGASPIVAAVRKGAMEIEPVERPDTMASAIRIGRPASWKKALLAIYGSRGTAVPVDDREIIRAQGLLASLEGIFVEPASAAPVAALRALLQEGAIDRDETTICIATGHGLKDPETPICRVSPLKVMAGAGEAGADLSSIISRPLGR